MEAKKSGTTLETFYPLPHQMQAMKAIENYDRSSAEGLPKFYFVGSAGSAKSSICIHMIAKFILKNRGCNFGIGRKSLPRLKKTTHKQLVEHFKGVKDLKVVPNKVTGDIHFPQIDSSISAFSWGDKDYDKFQSDEFAGFFIEELTENEDSEAHDRIIARIRSPKYADDLLFMAATNPKGPSHWAYEMLYGSGKDDLTHVFESNLTQNPYLPKGYKQTLLKTLSEVEARRLVYSEWVDYDTELIYYAYKREQNYRDQSYSINLAYPIYLCWDFNIGEGKPLSVGISQYIEEHFHFFSECVVKGFRTLDALETMASRGIFECKTKFIVHGDAAGKHNDTRSIRSDYDIIEKFLANYTRKDGSSLEFEMDVPKSNPPIKTRHNYVNGACKNALGEVNLTVYKDAPTIDEGLRKTKLKAKGSYIEDDGPKHPYQHVTTAIGYHIARIRKTEEYEREVGSGDVEF